MEKIFPELKDDYDRWNEKFTQNDHETTISCVINIDDVMRAHYLLCDYFIREGENIFNYGPREINLLVSAISRQTTGLNTMLKWKEQYEQCASLFYGLIKNHPFHDGNKRTALLTCLFFLQKTGKVPTGIQKEWEMLAVNTAGNTLDNYSWYSSSKKKYSNENDRRVFVISKFIKRNTRPEDKRHYTVTYNQLNALLHRFGYILDNPVGNRIDVIKVVLKRSGLFQKVVQQKERITHIGFPGWTREVSLKDLKIVREATGLIPSNGYDSEVFYRDADPLPSIISRYHSALLRLKDK